MEKAFATEIARQLGHSTIDHVVLNAGIKDYPNVRCLPLHHDPNVVSDRTREPLKRSPSLNFVAHTLMFGSSFGKIEDHMKTNAIGPIIVAQNLLQTDVVIGSFIFMSSDSGSTNNFREFEDGLVLEDLM